MIIFQIGGFLFSCIFATTIIGEMDLLQLIKKIQIFMK